MSIYQHPLLHTLPVEIINRICDFIDAKTILISFRNTCRRLRAIIRNYDKYVLDFKLISRFDFRLVCRLINPRQVKSLTLSNENQCVDQTILFNSMFGVRQFTNLCSLTLFAIEESQLEDILKRINISSLISFVLHIRRSNDRREYMENLLITSILAESKLQKLILIMQPGRIEHIEWPDKCKIKYLEFAVSVHFNQMNTILSRLSLLRELVIGNCSIEDICKTNFALCPQLTFLSLKEINMKIEYLELLPFSIPSLTNLKLVVNVNFLDCHRWEQFIQTKLPLLKKFEFYLHEHRPDQTNHPNIESIIASFQTPFWLKQKKWFVICEYNINLSQQVILYSIPLCAPSLNSQFESTKISVSSLDTTVNKNAPILVKADIIGFDFAKITINDIQQQLQQRITHPLFGTMKQLGVVFDVHLPVGWVPFISRVINLTTITRIALAGTVILKAKPDIVGDIKTLLQQASNCSSLVICGRSSVRTRPSFLKADDICSMIPAHVRNLDVSIKDLNETKIVLERLEHLSSMNFFFDYTPCWDQFHEWFKTKKQCLTYRTEPNSLHVWLTQSTNSTNELRADNKRIKLSNEHYH